MAETEPHSSSRENQRHVLKIIWWAILASTLLLTTVTMVGAIKATGVAGPHTPILIRVLYAYAITMGAGSLFCSRVWMSPRRIAGKLEAIQLPANLMGPEAKSFLEGQIEQMTFVPLLIAIVLAETVGIGGFMASIFTGDRSDCIPFTCGALALLYSAYPNPHRIHEQIKEFPVYGRKLGQFP